MDGISASSPDANFDTIGVFTLPDRTVAGIKNKYIFVERFSAPGGTEVMSEGAMDLVGAEVSVFNEMNQRNLSVRAPLNSYWQTHTTRFGLNSDNVSIGNFHKIHRNTRYVSTDNGVQAKYDNNFVIVKKTKRKKKKRKKKKK